MSFSSPPVIVQTVMERMSVNKVNLTVKQMIILGFLAGVYIAMGAQLTTRIYSMSGDPIAQTVLGSSAFTVGLMLVIISGAELFTGNHLMWMSVFSKHVRFSELMKNWFWVFCANFLGCIFLVLMMYGSGLLIDQNGVLTDAGKKAVDLAFMKSHLTFLQAVIRGILCNWLVCLAVWLALSAHDIVGKIFGIFFPIMAFVASGFEHSVANLYLLPMGWMLDHSRISIPMCINNLTAVILGNIIGGSFFVSSLYYVVYKPFLKKH